MHVATVASMPPGSIMFHGSMDQRVSVHKAGLFTAFALLAIVSGCSTLKLRQAQVAYQSHNIPRARERIDTFVAERGRGPDRVIAYLVQGSVRRSLGDFAASNDSLETADEAIARFDEGADISLSKEAWAVLTNLGTLPYTGYNYDRIMLNVYQALNYLELGDVGAARIELQQTYDRQREAVERHAARIEQAEAAAEQSRRTDGGHGANGYDIARAQQDQKFRDSIQAHYGDLSKYGAYADYVNPFAEWLQGIYYMAEGLDDSDLERARKSMERVLGMMPDNAFVQDDAEMMEHVSDGHAIPSVTYVVLATGTAPKREQVRIDIPLFHVTDDVDYVGVSFPNLVMSEDYLHELHIRVGSANVSTELLCDMDAVVAQEFSSELPILIIKTLIYGAIKAAATYQLGKSAKDKSSVWGRSWGWVEGAYWYLTNAADLRTWSSLAKQYQYARFSTPQGGEIELDAPGSPPTSVTLQPGTINVVMVRSINSRAPLDITQFSLGKGTQ